MSLQSLIDELEAIAPSGYQRSTGNRSLAKLIQDGLDELFEIEAPGRVWLRDVNTGFPPYLITVAGTQEYSITAANLYGVDTISIQYNGVEYPVRAYRVNSVFIDVTQYKYDYGRRWVGRPYVYYGTNNYSNAKTRLEVAEVPVSSYPAMENEPAKVVFREDPGSETQRYYCEFTWEHPRLDSESIPLMVPKRFERALFDYAMGTIQQRDNGRSSDYLDRFYVDNTAKGWSSWLSQWKSENRAGAQSEVNESELRPWG